MLSIYYSMTRDCCKCCGGKLNHAKYALSRGHLLKSCPECSTKNEDECIFYQCPDSFGFRNTIIQNYCNNCRANKTPPHEGSYNCSYVLENGQIITKCQLMPMSSDIIPSDEFDSFFLEVLPSRGYKYYYRKMKISNPVGTLVLFQYKATIRAFSVIIDVIHETINDGSNEYDGCYVLDRFNTVLISPINLETFRKYSSTIKVFNQSPQIIKDAELPSIFSLIQQGGMSPVLFVRNNRLPEA